MRRYNKVPKPTPEPEMTVAQFRKYCDRFDSNISDILGSDNFVISCAKCKSKKVQLLYNGKQISEGSEYTGCWTSQEMDLTFKCTKCGNAISIRDE